MLSNYAFRLAFYYSEHIRRYHISISSLIFYLLLQMFLQYLVLLRYHLIPKYLLVQILNYYPQVYLALVYLLFHHLVYVIIHHHLHMLKRSVLLRHWLPSYNHLHRFPSTSHMLLQYYNLDKHCFHEYFVSVHTIQLQMVHVYL